MRTKDATLRVIILFIIAAVGCGSSNYYRITDTDSGNTYYTKRVEMKDNGEVMFKDAATDNKLKLHRGADVQNITEDEFTAAVGGAAPVLRSLTISNSGSPETVYLVFMGGLTANGGTYAEDDFNSQGCQMYGADRCKMVVPKGSKTLSLNKGGINISGGLGNEPMGSCPTTMFEVNISPPNDASKDSYDVSLVNGYNHSIQLVATKGPSTTKVTSATGNHGSVGVFPLGCTVCIAEGSVPPQWDNCPGNSQSCGGQCFKAAECKSGPDASHPNAACVLQAPTGGSFSVAFGPK